MALAYAAGRFNTGTTLNTEIPITTGFTPVAIIFWIAGRTTTGPPALGVSHYRGIGFCTSPTSRRCSGSGSFDNQTAAVARGTLRNDAVIATMTSGGSIDGLLDVKSFDASGFTCIIDDAFAASVPVYYLALGGDVDAAAIVDVNQENADGNVDYTSVGWQPSVVFALAPHADATAWNATINDVSLGFGWATDGTHQGCWAGGSNYNSNPSVAKSYCRRGQLVRSYAAGAGTVGIGFELVQMLSTGFRLHWSGSTGAGTSRPYAMLCLRGGSFVAADAVSKMDTTTNINFTGLPTTGLAMMLLSHCKAESAADTSDANDEFCLASPGAPGTTTIEVHNVSPTKIEYRNNDSIYANLDTARAVEGLATHQTWNSDGATIKMTDADPAEALLLGLLIGSNTAAAVTGTVALTRQTHVVAASGGIGAVLVKGDPGGDDMRQLYYMDTNPARRRLYARLRNTDGTPATTEAGNKPKLSVNGGAAADTSAGWTAVSATYGLYYVELAQNEVGTGAAFLYYVKTGLEPWYQYCKVDVQADIGGGWQAVGGGANYVDIPTAVAPAFVPKGSIVLLMTGPGSPAMGVVSAYSQNGGAGGNGRITVDQNWETQPTGSTYGIVYLAPPPVPSQVADIESIAASTEAAQDLAAMATAGVRFTVGPGATTTSIPTDLTGADSDHFKYKMMILKSGAIKEQGRPIGGSTQGANCTLTLEAGYAFTRAPAQGDTGVLV